MVLFRRQAAPDDALAVALRHINPGLWISVPFRSSAARVVASRGAVILPGLGNPVTLFRRITRRSGNGFLRSRNGGSRESGDQRRCNQNTLVHVSSFYRLYLWAQHKAPEAASLPRPMTSNALVHVPRILLSLQVPDSASWPSASLGLAHHSDRTFSSRVYSRALTASGTSKGSMSRTIFSAFSVVSKTTRHRRHHEMWSSRARRSSAEP